MKKIILISAVALLLAACDDGSYFSDTPTETADSVMRLEAAGDDLRVYEFTPKTDETKQCVFVAGKRKGGLVCFDKKN